jgi:hypothetical protein
VPSPRIERPSAASTQIWPQDSFLANDISTSNKAFMATGGHSSRESSCGSNRNRDLSRCGDDVRRCERDVGCIYGGQAAHIRSRGADRLDNLAVGAESFWVSDYLIFDLKRTSLSSKAPLLCAS